VIIKKNKVAGVARLINNLSDSINQFLEDKNNLNLSINNKHG